VLVALDVSYHFEKNGFGDPKNIPILIGMHEQSQALPKGSWQGPGAQRSSM